MRYLVQNSNIIHIQTGEHSKSDILISNGLIETIKPTIDPTQFDGTVIDFSNKWIIPGLIDMHVHIKEGFAHLFTASGVTTVRNTAGNVIELSDMINAPANATTPRIYSADRLIDGPPGNWGETGPYNINLDDSNLARKEVQRQVALGADFIKVYGWLEKDVMAAVVEEARKYNKDVSCDLLQSYDVTAVHAANMGILWNEHCSGVIQSIFPNWSMKSKKNVWEQIEWDNPPEEKIHEVCLQLFEKDVIMCPTMILFDQLNRLENYWEIKNIVTEKMKQNKGLMQQWEYVLSHPDSLRKTGIQKIWNQKIAKIYADIGGCVVAGTDSPAGIFNPPGMGLHREMQLFIEAGFSNLEALQSATIHAAKALKNEQLGNVKEGAIADLVVLNSNPLEHIEATQDIAMIFKGGKPFMQQELLAQVPSEKIIKEKMKTFLARFEETTLPV
ncbi:amidohydrolase family protein [Viridibacillus arvi]|uniref:amidohydrolase family protein n=1 Tax=Viridibacillus arvi TaxID=263475 RepID=UPI0034D00B79